jgi:hypothetical protein
MTLRRNMHEHWIWATMPTVVSSCWDSQKTRETQEHNEIGRRKLVTTLAEISGNPRDVVSASYATSASIKNEPIGNHAYTPRGRRDKDSNGTDPGRTYYEFHVRPLFAQYGV